MNHWQIASAVMVWGALITFGSAEDQPQAPAAKPKVVDLEIRMIERVVDDKSAEKGTLAGKVLTPAETKEFFQKVTADPQTNVLFAPRMRLEVGKKGNLRTGAEYPIEVPNSKPGEDPTVEYLFAGTALEATVTEPKPGSFVVEFACEQSERVGDPKASIPSINKKSVQTRAELKSGQTYLLPRLQNERKVAIESRVAVLGEIPVVSDLFTKNRTESQKYELIVLVTVNLVEEPAK